MALIKLDGTLGEAALAIISPDVPDTDGVPPVIRSRLREVTAIASIITADSAGVTQKAESQWGIYDTSGSRVLVADSIQSFEIAAESRAASYPIEGGGFESYNKVQMPFPVRLEMAKVGKKAERAAFLNKIEEMRRSTDLFDVMTPEKTYLNVTLTRYNIVRNSDTGPQRLLVQVVMEEIREEAQVQFTNELTPSTLTTPSTGAVQTSTTAATGSPK